MRRPRAGSKQSLKAQVTRLGKLAARIERELASAEALGEALIERADEIERVRLDDMERLRKMMEQETDAYRLRGIEQQYVAAAVDRDRARRVGRYQRDQKLRREEQKQLTPGYLVGD